MNMRKFLYRFYKPIARVIAPPLNSSPLIAPLWKKLKYLAKRLFPRIVIFDGHRIDFGPNTSLFFAYDYPKSYGASPYLLLQKVLKPGMTVVNVGANIGLFTLKAAQLVGPKGRVYAFEPHPENFETLERNIKLNGYQNIIALNKAVTNLNGIVELFTNPFNSGGHSIFRNPFSTGPMIKVKSICLDDFIEKEGLTKVDLVKIDVEGAEPLVIEGMKKLIYRSNLKLIMELNPPCLEAGGFNPRDFLCQLYELGFVISVIRYPAELEPLTNPDSLLEELRHWRKFKVDEIGNYPEYRDLYCEKF